MLWVPTALRVQLWYGGKDLGPGVLPPTRGVILGSHLPSWGHIRRMLEEAFLIPISQSQSHHQA